MNISYLCSLVIRGVGGEYATSECNLTRDTLLLADLDSISDQCVETRFIRLKRHGDGKTLLCEFRWCPAALSADYEVPGIPVVIAIKRPFRSLQSTRLKFG